MTETTRILVEIECPDCYETVRWAVSVEPEDWASLPSTGCPGKSCTTIHQGDVSSEQGRIQKLVDDEGTPVAVGRD